MPARAGARRGVRVLAGLCLGLSGFAYPPLLVAVAVAYAVRLALSRGAVRRAMVIYDAPSLALPLVAMAAVVASVGLHRFRADVRARSSIELGSASDLYDLGVHQLNTLRHPILLIVALVVLVLVWRWRPAVASPVVLTLPLLVLPPGSISIESSLEYVAHYAWLALPLFLIVRGRRGASQLLGVAWLPGIAGGIMTGVSSSNGALNAGTGALPAALVSSAFLIWSLEELLPRRLDRARCRAGRGEPGVPPSSR